MGEIPVYKEGDVIKVTGDYEQYFSQAGVRGDPDGNNLRAMLWHNTVCLYTCDSNWKPQIRIGNALFIRERTALIPAHYLRRLRAINEDGTKVRFCFYRLQSNMHWCGTIDDCIVLEAAAQAGETRLDLASITFRSVVNFPNIMNHFVRLSDMSHYSSIPAVLTTVSPHIQTKNGVDLLTLFIKEYHVMHAYALEAKHVNDEFEYDKGRWRVRHGYKYNVATIDGDCGAALTAICRELPRKILGIHVCGNDTSGVSVATYRELVDQLIPTSEQFRSQDGCPEITMGHFENKEIKDYYSETVCFYESEFTDDRGTKVPGGMCCALMSPFIGSTFPIGTSIYSGIHSEKDKIEPSVLQGNPKVPWKSVKKKAILSDYYDENGERVFIKKNAIDKLHADFKFIDHVSLTECVDDAMRPVFSVEGYEKYARILSIEEAVFGVIEGRKVLNLPPDPFLSCIGSINLNSSPGKVWEKKRAGSKKGKHTWFDLDTKWIDPEVYRAINEQMLQWEHCYRCADVFSGEIKSELRTPPKHLSPRMYNSGDMITMINTKRLFAGLVALLQKHWAETGVTVGINCHKDFRQLMMLLQQHGVHCFDGDFAKFDGSLAALLLLAVMCGFIDFYRKSMKVFDRATENAMYTASHVIRFAVIIVMGRFLILFKSNPSGNYLTTQLNSYCVKVGCRLTWRAVFKDKPDMRSLVKYNEHVYEVANGDDNVLNVSDEAIEFFNQQTVSVAFKEVLDMTYTDANKSGKLVKSKPLFRIQYLKRHMTDGPAGALDCDSILESVLWYKRGVSSEDNFHSTLSSACHEAYHHGREFYNWFRDGVLSGLAGTEHAHIRLLTFGEAQDLYLYAMREGQSFGFAY